VGAEHDGGRGRLRVQAGRKLGAELLRFHISAPVPERDGHLRVATLDPGAPLDGNATVPTRSCPTSRHGSYRDEKPDERSCENEHPAVSLRRFTRAHKYVFAKLT
jgi:hypothetical protein